MNKHRICCILGQRTIEKTKELSIQLYDIIEKLILNENVDTNRKSGTKIALDYAIKKENAS